MKTLLDSGIKIDDEKLVILSYAGNWVLKNFHLKHAFD